MISPMRRRLAKIGIAVVAVYGILTAALAWAMRQPPEVFGRIMAHVPMPLMIVLPFEPLWMNARAGHLNVGDEAPDFMLPTTSHDANVQLASFRRRQPVVLVFGSYT